MLERARCDSFSKKAITSKKKYYNKIVQQLRQVGSFMQLGQNTIAMAKISLCIQMLSETCA